MFDYNFSGLLDTAGDYLGSGMDYISELMPERQKMKSYIDGTYDDRVIDYVADKWSALRGLLGPEPYERGDLPREMPYDPTAEYFSSDYKPYNPMSEYMEVQQMPARRFADAFKSDLVPDPLSGGMMPKGGWDNNLVPDPLSGGMMPKGGWDQRKRPKIMDALETANQLAPRPMTGYQDIYPEYDALRKLKPISILENYRNRMK